MLDNALEAENALTNERTNERTVYHCFFEQSGTFKNEFRKLGYEAYDYDILDDFGQTDFKIDLFAEIEKAYDGEKSIFDKISTEDVIMAFFPCTRFEAKIPLSFRGESCQLKNWSYEKKLEYSMTLHEQLHHNYMLISKMAHIVISKRLKMVIENPYTQPHYLTTYWCIRPTIIDKDRSLDGDYMKKPTQYWFLGFKPKYNIVFEPIQQVETRVCDRIKGNSHSRQVLRSEIHPQYANRFIRKYLIDGEEEKGEQYGQMSLDLKGGGTD